MDKPQVPFQLSRRHILAALVPGVAWWVLRQDASAAPSTPNVDQKTQRYEDLTAAEMVSMTVGLSRFRTDPHRGTRIMQLSLDLEHLISVLPLDPARVEGADLAEVRQLRNELTTLSGVRVQLHLLGDFLTGEEGQDNGERKKKTIQTSTKQPVGDGWFYDPESKCWWKYLK